jgi:iron complex transport system substrate-binding protein
MKRLFIKRYLLFLFFILLSCNQSPKGSKIPSTSVKNEIVHAKGLAIYKYKGYSIVVVKSPWPEAKTDFTYILKEKNTTLPDSLKQFTTVSVPIQNIVVTSTTHIPALELLGVENTLIGFPDTQYISSEKTRKRIDSGKIIDVGKNESLNTEILIDLAPSVLVSFGINNSNPALDNLEKSGLKVMLNGDWNEQTPLGKAEWIKFFGALYGLESQAATAFNTIEKEYNSTLALANKATSKPSVLCGALYQNQWYVPQGESWAALFLKAAKANYLWQNSKGTGSLALPFETILDKAQKADFWIAPGDFSSLQEMSNQNPHYQQFAAFQNKKVYSYAKKRGATGGIVYFELAATRPDLVLKDLIKIIHPELVPNHTLFFFEPLK